MERNSKAETSGNLEMERDCMISHGTAAFLKERLFTVSDQYSIPVCDNCGTITATEKFCHACKGNRVVICNFPYASKLLHQELTSMCLKQNLYPNNS